MGKATREAYGNALARIGKENTNIIVLDADLSKSTKTDTFKAVCPERFFNVGIAEQNLISVGAGLERQVRYHLYHLSPCLLQDVHLNKFAMLYAILN